MGILEAPASTADREFHNVRLVIGATYTLPRVPSFSTSDWLEITRQQLHAVDASRRLAVARTFAEQIRGIAFVREVWFSERGGHATITAVVDSDGLENELRLEAALTAIVATTVEPFDGHLSIESEAAGVPEFVRGGLRLLPE